MKVTKADPSVPLIKHGHFRGPLSFRPRAVYTLRSRNPSVFLGPLNGGKSRRVNTLRIIYLIGRERFEKSSEMQSEFARSTAQTFEWVELRNQFRIIVHRKRMSRHIRNLFLELLLWKYKHFNFFDRKFFGYVLVLLLFSFWFDLTYYRVKFIT